MNLLSPKIEEYVLEHTQPENKVLRKLTLETYAKVMEPRMLSGNIQGRALSMFSHMIKPTNILEIGTFTGYSAICLAEGLCEGGKLYTIDINEALGTMVRKYFAEAGITDKVEFLTGDATKIIPAMDIKFNLVFIDADKRNYSNYYDLVFDKVNKGGFIIADNVLWSGKVTEDPSIQDKDTAALVAFSKKVHNDPRVQNYLLPIRDGLMIIRKI